MHFHNQPCANVLLNDLVLIEFFALIYTSEHRSQSVQFSIKFFDPLFSCFTSASGCLSIFQMFKVKDHHRKGEVCRTRPPYRNGRKLRAVKTYTIADESKYLLIQNIPSIPGNVDELLPYLNEYGPVQEYRRLVNDPPQPFLETILVRYQKIEHARRCKFYFDDWNFLGGTLHICYAPECETVEDLREKIEERRQIVEHKSILNHRYPRGNGAKRKPSDDLSSKRTIDEVRQRIRTAIEKSNFISVVLQHDETKRKRLQL